MTDNNPDVRKPLILIAEDVESNYKLLEIILKKEYDLLWAKNGREAVDFAMEHKPDAILMDIKMPVMDGIEALKEIRRHTAELPVIMQTAYAFDTDRRTAEEAGCNGFITKPVMPRELNTLSNNETGPGTTVANPPHTHTSSSGPAPENRRSAQDSKQAGQTVRLVFTRLSGASADARSGIKRRPSDADKTRKHEINL